MTRSWRSFCEAQDWDTLASLARARDAGQLPSFTQGREDAYPVTWHVTAPPEGISYPRAVFYTEDK